MARQSFPFTYIYVDLASNDGQAHDVQVYLDISGGTSILMFVFFCVLIESQNGYHRIVVWR